MKFLIQQLCIGRPALSEGRLRFIPNQGFLLSADLLVGGPLLLQVGAALEGRSHERHLTGLAVSELKLEDALTGGPGLKFCALTASLLVEKRQCKQVFPRTSCLSKSSVSFQR